MDPTFTEFDQRFVLGEIIKASDLDVGTLVDFICKNNVQPNWIRMQLPCGRNLLQVWKAAEVMFNAPLNPPPTAQFSSLKRKSLGDLNEHGPKRLATSPVDHSTPPLPPIMHAPQPQNAHSPLNASRNLSIQPRPASNGYQQSPTAAPQPMTPALPQSVGRKRGRPSKADKEAQARANGSAAPMPGAPLPSLAPHPASQHFHAPSPPNNSLVGPNIGSAQPRYITGHDPYVPSPAARAQFASAVAEDAGRGANVRWRDPMTVASHLPTGEKREMRTVSDSIVQKASTEPRSIERPERSPSVSNLITPTDEGGGLASIPGRHSPVVQSVAARHAIYGSNVNSGSQSSAEHESRPVSGHERRTQTSVSNAA